MIINPIKPRKPGKNKNRDSVKQGKKLDAARYTAMGKRYVEGAKDAQKALKYKPKSKSYKTVSKKLAEKGDMRSQGALSTFKKAAKGQVAKGKGGVRVSSKMNNRITASIRKQKQERGLVGVIKANEFKPVANKIENSKYRKLDKKLRKNGSERAKGALRGISVLRKDAAMARRGSVPVATSKSKNTGSDKTKVVSKPKSPVTSIGGYKGRDFQGKKIKPKTTSGTKAKIKNNTKFTGTTVSKKKK